LHIDNDIGYFTIDENTKGGTVMMLKMCSLLIVMAAVLGMVVPADAGWVMLEQNGEKALISNGRLKGTSKGVSSIFNGPKKEIIFIHDGQNIYWRGTVDDYCSNLTTLLEQMMKGMPEELRKMREQMMAKGNQPPDHKVTVEKKGNGETIAGLKTTKYRVMVDGELFEEVWLTTDASLMKEYEPLVPLLQKFSSCLGSMNMEFTPEKSADYQKLWEAGYQLKGVKYELGSPQTETDVVKIEKADIPDQEFEVPAGYQQRSFAETMQSQME
jgi:hypothetical protein